MSSTAQDQQNIFLNPPTNGVNNDFTLNPTYVQGSTITLQWQTTYPATDLVIWQNNNPDSQLLAADITTTSLSWTVGTGENPPFDLSNGTVFFFQMYNSSTTTFFSSHYFNVSDPSLASASATASSSTTTTSLPAAISSTQAPTSSQGGNPLKTSAIATSSATTTPTSSADSSSGHGDSSNSKLGEGLGLGIGVCVLLIALAGLLWYFFRRRGRSQHAPSKTDLLQPETTSVYPQGGGAGYDPRPSPYHRYELGSKEPSTQAELDGGGTMKAV
ncbi:uncharacterized protein Z520_04939 [Fonsecaea multimorphosa CBS 102226]|uniref:Mid2 domain-containing protein n=1 Tax=Fonsecaea multimorphosa CBS 102226 TaxID=1442371 RepID=A0A0D2KRP1_9EURO|nr:uncharacterized protein Z520_04939 [Fonsecaea multimorphosa CBS 102226]KIX99363.1 hypothetical protein Z520_04939 [Fonsecaea multimorphosa CBS 102226]OAL25693.1 hypothetical protein AYO22_04682 [Fonsecaea multimorphosa]